MAKKIEGYVDGTGEGPEFAPYKEGNQYFPFWEAQGITLNPKFDYWRRAVVVVTDERVFTESEVRRIMKEAFGERTGKGQGITWYAMVEAVRHFGIVLDPA